MPVERASGGTSLIDVLDRVLDKGIVIDAWVRVSLVGIDLITVEARVVVASIDTYLILRGGRFVVDSRRQGDRYQGARGAPGGERGTQGPDHGRQNPRPRPQTRGVSRGEAGGRHPDVAGG